MKPTQAVGGVVAFVVGVAHFGVANVDLLQSIVLPAAFTLAPRVAWLNEALLQRAAIFLTAGVIGLGLFRLADRARERF